MEINRRSHIESSYCIISFQNEKNVTGRMLKLKEVSVEADGNIFPLKLTYSENSTSENKTNKLSIKFNDKEFADGNEINAYMNIFPTGDIKKQDSCF